MPEAARITDPIGHVSFWARLARVALRVGTSLLEGLAVAALITVAIGGSIATMGCGAIIVGGLVAGFIGGATGYSSWKEKKINELTEDIGSPTITGALSLIGSANVLINNLLAARAVTDTAVCSKDSGPPIPVAEGSDSVWINTFPAARKGDKLKCSAKITKGSENVFVGGNKTAYMEIAEDKEWWETGLELAIGLVMMRGSFPGRIACMGLGMIAGMAADQLGKGFRSLIGYPVNPATGGKVLLGDADTDFVLPGPIPIEWKRRYSSNDDRADGILGQGWSIPYSVELQFENRGQVDERIVYIDQQGRKIDLPSLRPGTGLYNTAEQFTISCTPGGYFEIKTLDNQYFQFGIVPPEAKGRYTLRLKRIVDLHRNWLAFQYDDRDRLDQISDSIGRKLRIEYDVTNDRAKAIYVNQGAQGEVPTQLVQYHYDAHRQLSTVKDRTGAIVRQFEYSGGLMVQQRFADGFTCHYEWQSAATSNGPDGSPRVIRHWTNDGESYAISYSVSATGGATTAKDQLGRIYRWDWDTRYNLTAFRDPLGHLWSMKWNSDSQLEGVRNPGGDVITFRYNAHGLPVTETDGLGRSTVTLWEDRWNKPLRITYPDGSSYQYEYDDRGENTAVTDPLGRVTRYAYDTKGSVVKIVDAKGGSKYLTWNDRAQITSYTDCSNKTTRYVYDSNAHLSTITDALNQTTSFVYDATGRLLSTTTPDGATQSFQYDSAGRLIGAVDPLNHITKFLLDQRGRLLQRTDASGRSVALTYDAAQRLSSLVNENGQSFRFHYDDSDRLVEETRVDGTRVHVEYNANGLPVGVTHTPAIGDSVDGATSANIRTELVRDVVGRLVEKRTPTHHYRYRFDELDRLVGATKFKISYTGDIDLKGNAYEELHRASFSYDLVGNLIEEIAADAISGEEYVLKHAHDGLNNRLQTALPNLPTGSDPLRAINYLYYGSGHLHQINLSHATKPGATHAGEQSILGQESIHQLIADIERDDLHREVHRSQGALASRYAYDALGRKTGIWTRAINFASRPFAPGQDSAFAQVLSMPNASDGLGKQYRYDLAGELRERLHSQQGALAYHYDASGYVTQTTRKARSGHHASEQFAYDPAGNILSRVDANASSSSGTAQRGLVVDNLVRVFEDKRYAYDGHARLIEKKSGKHTVQRFDWDDEHRLIAVHTTRRPNTPEAVTQSTRFDYDAIGRRIAKHDAFGTTRFIWEGMRLIEERRGSSVVTYVYEPNSYVPLARIDAEGNATESGGLGTLDDTESTDAARQPSTNQERPLNASAANDDTVGSRDNWDALHTPRNRDAKQRASSEPKLANVYYFHTDQVGLPEELSDSAGQIRWRAAYKTWGNTISERWEAVDLSGEALGQRADNPHEDDQPLPINQNLRFQGQYLDRETALHYNTFRYYDPDIGRFISPDPIGLWGGLNQHSYAPNPTMWIDPLGWQSLLPGELSVGTYDDLIRAGRPGDNITPHHMPSGAYMRNHGVAYGDAIAMNMEHNYPSNTGRHSETRTFRQRPFLNETPRQALARDIADARRIYQRQGLYTPEVRASLREVIRLNKQNHPNLFGRPKKTGC